MTKPRLWVITGASGWFGRTALWEYEQLHGPLALRKNVIACSSAAKTIDFGSSYGPIETVSIDALSSIVGASGLIHLAFITRDKLQQFGPESYIAQNRLITAKVADFIYNNPTIPILTTSSGAAAVFDHSEVDLYSDPYAALNKRRSNFGVTVPMTG